MKGIAAGAAARIFPMTRPFANSLSRFEGTPKLSTVSLFFLFGFLEELKTPDQGFVTVY